MATGKPLRTIKITLNHDYLKIEDDKKGGNEMQLPLRAAKLIADMFLASGIDRHQIERMCDGGKSSYPIANAQYELGFYNQHAEMDNEFHWIKKTVTPLEVKK